MLGPRSNFYAIELGPVYAPYWYWDPVRRESLQYARSLSIAQDKGACLLAPRAPSVDRCSSIRTTPKGFNYQNMGTV